MTSRDRAQLEHIVADRLEDLQRAGVVQLPRRVARRRPVDAADAHPNRGAATPSAVPASCGAGLEIAATISPATPADQRPAPNSEPAAHTGTTSRGTSDQGRQPVRPGSLFQPPDATSPASTPALTLEVLRQQVAACTQCDELAGKRTQTVFGVGNPKTRLCFLGEAPGADEDRTGIPFVGRAGQLLTRIIEACKLKRDDVYILNMVKCRPPDNRNPLPHELANCRGFLESQLDLIRPEYICCLGAVAAQNLLGTTLTIGKLRGKLHEFHGAKVVCTYHPAFLLRSPAFKKETWDDMKFLMREMGVEL